MKYYEKPELQMICIMKEDILTGSKLTSNDFNDFDVISWFELK